MQNFLRGYVVLALLVLASSLAAQKPVELKGTPKPAAESSAADIKDPKDGQALADPNAPADPNAAQDPNPPSIRSFSRMVLVDVVAKDPQGKPIRGLTANDFELVEDGQPQKIVSFTQESSPLLAPTAAAPERPLSAEDTVSNRDADAKAPPSMIVLDLLNTSTSDRFMAQQALTKYVKERMRRGETLAIFVLGNKLELLQDFSRDPRQVAAAANSAQRPVIDPNQKPAAADAAFLAAELEFGPLISTIEQAERLFRNEKEVEAHQSITRVHRTLESMRSLARYAARQKGRKSLVWLSAGFPFFLLTDMGMTGFETEMRQTSNLLASAQVAVYPVDVRGLVNIESQPLEDRTRRAQIWNPQENVDKLRTESKYDRLTPQSYVENKFNFSQSQDSMKEIADLTGGTAYMNRNDIDVAIAAALDENRDIYSLGYYPTKKDFNNRFRRIKVRLKGREAANLRYRRGYYATGFSIEGRVNTDLIAALENDPTVSPQIELVSRVQPVPPVANQPFRVELFVKGGSIQYSPSANRSAAFLDFAVVALSPNGTPMARTFRRGELKFDAKGLAKAERSGFVYSLPVNLPAGEYKLRAGVRDSLTGRIGTVEIPVLVK